jgi:LacI family transcriptional regulator
MATLKDVAKETGLALGTVSRYINGEQLKPQNMKAIENAIRKLGYETNSIARSMKTGKTMMIAVIVPYLANMFSMRVIESIEKELKKDNYSVIVTDCHGNEEEELRRIEFLKCRQVDGIVLMPSGSSAANIIERAGKTPLILIDRILDEPVFDSVIIDNERMTYDQVRKLLENGIKKIGIIEGPDHISTAVQRKKGYVRALSEYGIENVHVAKCNEYSYEEGYKAMKQLETAALEAVFASNYELSVGAVNASNDTTLRILGFDTFEIPVRSQENYTGIQQPIEKIGKLSAITLMNRVKDPDKPIENIII